MKIKPKITWLLLIILTIIYSCSTNNTNLNNATKTDSTSVNNKNTSPSAIDQDTTKTSVNSNDNAEDKNQISNLPVVLNYNFHVTNRCPSCIAIEEATTKTLNTYFSKELKQGRIKRQVINVDDDANEKIAEHYQAFGSALYVTRLLKGKETTTDLTGDGFKYARSKEYIFMDILKTKINEYLK